MLDDVIVCILLYINFITQSHLMIGQEKTVCILDSYIQLTSGKHRNNDDTLKWH